MSPDQVIALLALLAAVGGLLAMWGLLHALACLMDLPKEPPKWSPTKFD